MIIDLIAYNGKELRFSSLEESLLFACDIDSEFTIWVDGDLFMTHYESLETGDFVTTSHFYTR